jgi:hypothetical protein
MRPIAGSEAFQPRSRKPSLAEPQHVPTAGSTSPVAFLLRRGSQGDEANEPTGLLFRQGASSPQMLVGTLDHATSSTSTLLGRNGTHEAAQSPRRRSNLKAKESPSSDDSPPTVEPIPSVQPEALTPLLIPSEMSSLPSSPKSASTRSFRPSEAGSAPGDTGSQALLSSGDEEVEPEPFAEQAGQAPQLIMPSIKIPTRRPFTERGRGICNFKILVAGRRGFSLFLTAAIVC